MPHQSTFVQVPLRDREGSVLAYATIDAGDSATISCHRWSLGREHGYAYRQSKDEGRIYLHRAILGLTKGDPREGDHIDGNRLDCRRSNLRIVTRAQNGQNLHRHTERSEASVFRGVSWSRAASKWRAHVVVNYQQHHLGLFESEIEAARVAEEFRRKHLPFAEPDQALATCE
jgi:hypothetical protein